MDAQVQQVVSEMVTAITPDLSWLFIRCLATVLIVMVFYSIIRNAAAHVMVRIDKELSKNVRVVYEGEKGYIAHIGYRHMVIRLKGGNEVLVPIQRVGSMTWIIERHNGHYG